MISYEEKYLKYKKKYMDLKIQTGGNCELKPSFIPIDVTAIINEFSQTLDDIRNKIQIQPNLKNQLMEKLRNPDRRLYIQLRQKENDVENKLIKINNNVISRDVRLLCSKPDSFISNLIGFGFNINCDMKSLNEKLENGNRKIFIIDFANLVGQLIPILKTLDDDQKSKLEKANIYLNPDQIGEMEKLIENFIKREIKNGAILIIIAKPYKDVDIRTISRNLNGQLENNVYVINTIIKDSDKDEKKESSGVDDYIFWIISSAAYSYYHYKIYGDKDSEKIGHWQKNSIREKFVLITNDKQNFNEKKTLFSDIFPETHSEKGIPKYKPYLIHTIDNGEKEKEWPCETDYVNIITDIFLLDGHNIIAPIYKPIENVEEWIPSWTTLVNSNNKILSSYAIDFHRYVRKVQNVIFDALSMPSNDIQKLFL